VVKPARGEQGAGISVDVRDPETLERAIAAARRVCDKVILEEFVAGDDLRIVVIADKVVAAALRRPAEVIGTGQHSVRDLIQTKSRRRRAATGGESSIPMDDETRRCVQAAGYDMEAILPEGEVLQVRKTANLHTGGTIHDVTSELHPALAEAAVAAARALAIPVTGLDFLVPSVRGDDYVIIEANERPGLANHEPQPTAERFVDLLFPQTAARE
jgi:GNAT-family acetyltransferase (TIGR03103 family)